MVYSSQNVDEMDRPNVPHGGFNFDGSRGEHRPAEWVHTRKLLTRYMPQRKQRTTKKLLSSSSTTEPEEEEEEDSLFAKAPRPVVSFYHPNVSVEVVCDSGALPYHTLPPAIKSNIQLAKQKTYDGKDAYLPPVYVNDFWLLKGVSLFLISRLSLTRNLRASSERTAEHESYQLYDYYSASSSLVQADLTLQIPTLRVDARFFRETIFESLSWRVGRRRWEWE